MHTPALFIGMVLLSLIIMRNHLQLRQTERSMSILTPLHLTLIKDILRLSVSEYAEVSENVV
jgi:hypothetical protein